MDTARHLRILSWLYVVLSTPLFLLGVGVTMWAGAEGGEGGLIALPAMIVATIAFFPMVAGIGLRRGSSWSMALAVICALLMLASVILAPLAIYTFYVAYHRWSGNFSPSATSAPSLQGVREFVGRATFPMQLRPHARILGSLWVLVAIFPLYMGVVLFSEGASEFAERGWQTFELYSGLGFFLIGITAAAIARGVFRQRTWALLIATLCALPLITMAPFGTLLAGYTIFVAVLAWRTANAEPAVNEVADV